MLSESRIGIDFGMGVEQGVDEKQIIPGKLITAKNVRLEKAKRLSKRYGYARQGGMSADILDALGNRVFSHVIDTSGAVENRLVGLPSASFKSGSPVALSRRSIECSARGVRVGGAINEQVLVDSATIGTMTMYVWEESTANTVYYSAVDESTGQTIVTPTQLRNGQNVSRPRVIACNGKFLIGCANATATQIEVFAWDPATTSILNTPTSTYGTLSASSNWDWADFGTYVVMAYYGTGNVIQVARVSSAGASLTTTSFATVATNNAVAVCKPFSQFSVNVRILWHDNTGGTQVRYFVAATLAAGALGGANRVIDATVTADENIGAIENEAATGFAVLYQVTAAATYNRKTLYSEWTDGTPPTVSFTTRTQLSVGLASKPWRRNGWTYCLCAHDSTLQKSYFVFKFNSIAGVSARVTARMFYGVGGGLTTRPLLPNVNVLDADRYSCALIFRARTFTSNGYVTALRQLGEGIFDFSVVGTNRSVELASTKTITGGVLSQFDAGPTLVELGFLLFPENITSAQTGGGALADGQYQHVVYYEWTDNRGKLHRSAASAPIITTVAAGGGAASITLTIPTLRITLKDISMADARSSIRIAVGRMEVNSADEVFYRVSSIPPSTTNNPATDTVTFVDTISDATLITRETMPISSGELDSFVPDSPTAIAANPERVFCNDGCDDGIVWFSKRLVDGEGVQFAREFFQRLPTEDGPVTALATHGSTTVIAFKANGAYVMTGDGPDSTGQFGSYSAFDKVINFDSGCRKQSACVTTPIGTIVFGSKGFHLLGLDLSCTYIGKAVKDYESQTVISSAVLLQKKEVRFVMSGGTILHFNYEFPDAENPGQWFWSDFSALDCVATPDGSFYVIESSTRTVYKEDSTRFTDEALGLAGANRNIPLGIETANIAVGGINGYQRTWCFYILGNYKDAHNLLVEIAYDEETAFQAATFTVAGASVVANGKAYRIKVELKIQKCSSFRVRLSDDGSGEALNLTTMTIFAGVKKGGAKLRASNRVS